jgi:hypothetical protein
MKVGRTSRRGSDTGGGARSTSKAVWSAGRVVAALCLAATTTLSAHHVAGHYPLCPTTRLWGREAGCSSSAARWCA